MVSHKARKRFGQNFLTDNLIIADIIQAISPKQSDHVVEIGPGLGALTEPLVQSGCHLDVIELDWDLIPKLQQHYPSISIHQADALTFDFASLVEQGQKLRIVGNLPYNISTPLLFHLLQYADCIQDMFFMLQKEVVERLGATVGTGDYGRLSVMMQYYCHVTPLFLVPPSAFSPRPKVDSAIVKLSPYSILPFVAQQFEQFAVIVREAFNQRRKTIRNSLREFISASDLESLGINPQLRAEQLSIADFILIEQDIHTKKSSKNQKTV